MCEPENRNKGTNSAILEHIDICIELPLVETISI
jgi:hypothetical protein